MLGTFYDKIVNPPPTSHLPSPISHLPTPNK
jgi:hypothetical protein